MSKTGRLLLGALGLAALGGTAFVGGIGAAFGRAGNWSNTLASFGVLLLVGSGILAIAAVMAGMANSIKTRRFNWWLPLACIAAGLAIWCGWIAINL